MSFDNFYWSSRYQLARAARDADQAELAAIQVNTSSASISILDERIAELTEDGIIDDIDDPLSTQIQRDHQLDSLMSTTLEEIERRQNLLGEKYPFTLDKGTLRYTKSQTGVYEYCLAISSAPTVTETPFTELIRYFEIFAADVVRAYLGEGASFLRTGAPAITHPRSSKNLQDAFERVYGETGEWKWDPHDEAKGDQGNVQDEGLDFMVWKKIDNRNGSLFIMGQCACGNSNWYDKDQDLDADFKKIGRWVRKLSHVKPVRAFAIPHPVTSRNVFVTLSERAGLTIDRIRLTKIAEAMPNREHFIREHKPTIERLTKIITGL